ncbi:MAG: VUT family protein [Clostridia bacterium]|nr:VUT family protein [Clostridia bacterium]
MNDRIRRGIADTRLLFRSIPSVVTALFTISVVAMNLLANKTIYQSYWLALDGGILISWLSFLCMDIVTKAFGPKASTKLSIFAVCVNLLVCLIFFIVSVIPSKADDYTEFNRIIGGTWFILLSSTVAFLSSAVINNFLNYGIGLVFRKNPDGKAAYVTRTYISTFIGQFFDNFIFSVLTFMLFAPIFWDGFHWTLLQCFTCALLGAGLELLMEAVFSPIGYIVLKQWKKDGVGEEYLRRAGS